MLLEMTLEDSLSKMLEAIVNMEQQIEISKKNTRMNKGK